MEGCMMPAHPTPAGLVRVPHERIVLFSSPTTTARARSLADLLDSARTYFGEKLAVESRVRALVVSEADWPAHTAYPVFGMPHYLDPTTLIVAGERADFWLALAPPVQRVPPEWRERYARAYAREGPLDPSPFFDLLAVHELAHLYLEQGTRDMPNRWLTELFCNVALDAFVTERAPDLLEALHVLPEIILAMPPPLAHRGLAEMDPAENAPENYGWYQSGLHRAAARMVRSEGPDVLDRLWREGPGLAVSNDGALANAIGQRISPTLAAIVRAWR